MAPTNHLNYDGFGEEAVQSYFRTNGHNKNELGRGSVDTATH